MIIVRSPLRVTLGGGGTDLPSYYRDHEGFVISAAIDKYIYVNIMRPFTRGIYLKYSQLEHVEQIAEVKHPIIREVLSFLNLKTPQVEITTVADIPAGTGLGSSGSFTTGLLKGLYAHRKNYLHQEELAKLACHIEIDRLKEPVGKQDQYISAIGGISCLTFHKNDDVSITPLAISMDTILDLEENLLLFFTGFSRNASDILRDQDHRSQQGEVSMLENMHYAKNLGYLSRSALEDGNIQLFGELMHEHWEHKKNRTVGMTNPKIDEWYQLGRQSGAIGGKLVGAGGGGFLMFVAHDRNKLRQSMKSVGLEEVRFHFDFEGVKIMSSS